MPFEISLIEFYGGYALYSLVVTLIATPFLSKHFEHSYKSIFFFLFVFNFIIIGLGTFFTMWLIYYILHVEHKESIHDTKIINLDEFDNEFIDVKRVLGESSMKGLIQSEYAANSLKMKALVSMSDNISRDNISIFKQSLSSSNDEIRLFCFSTIDSMERDINGKIHIKLLAFKEANDELDIALIAKELAFLYWETLYLELSDEQLKSFLLHESLKYVKISLKAYKFDIKARVLLGRIYMMQEIYHKAAREFRLAIQLDKNNMSYVLPYLAEIQYNMGNYASVKDILNDSENLNLNATLSPIVEIWKKAS